MVYWSSRITHLKSMATYDVTLEKYFIGDHFYVCFLKNNSYIINHLYHSCSKGENSKIKNKLVLTLALVVMLTAFTGCEPQLSSPELTINERMTIVKGYNDEIFTLMTSTLDDSSPSDFSEGDSILEDEEGLTCIVTAADLDEINLFMSFDGWVADDGAEINGNMILDVEYYTSPVSFNSIRTGIPASLYFDRSSVI